MRFLACALLLVTFAVTYGGKVCKPFTTRKIESDSCDCPRDGSGWICETELPKSGDHSENPYLRKKRAAPVHPVDRCEPGRRFNYYCNACICSWRGTVPSSRCTHIKCDFSKWHRNGTRIVTPPKNNN